MANRLSCFSPVQTSSMFEAIRIVEHGGTLSTAKLRQLETAFRLARHRIALATVANCCPLDVRLQLVGHWFVSVHSKISYRGTIVSIPGAIGLASHVAPPAW